MEMTHTSRSAAAVAREVPQRALSPAGAEAVKTTLPWDSAVQQTPEAPAVQVELSRGVHERAALNEAVSESTHRRIIIDFRTHEVVSQSVDVKTGRVVSQIPAEDLLRLRAYLRELTVEAQVSGDRNQKKVA